MITSYCCKLIVFLATVKHIVLTSHQPFNALSQSKHYREEMIVQLQLKMEDSVSSKEKEDSDKLS